MHYSTSYGPPQQDVGWCTSGTPQGKRLTKHNAGAKASHCLRRALEMILALVRRYQWKIPHSIHLSMRERPLRLLSLSSYPLMYCWQCAGYWLEMFMFSARPNPNLQSRSRPQDPHMFGMSSWLATTRKLRARASRTRRSSDGRYQRFEDLCRGKTIDRSLRA
jgi:hypothetical protein